MSLPKGRYEYVSPASYDLFGYTPAEFYESPMLIQKIIHPDWQNFFEEQWTRLIDGNMPPSYEYQIIHKSGETKWIHQRNILIIDNSGQPIAIEGIVWDITEGKKSEIVLKESEEKFRAIFDEETDGIILADIEEKSFYLVNKEMAEITGYSVEELRKMCVPDLHPEKDLPYVIEQFEKQSRKEIKLAKDLPVKRKDGTIIYCDINSTPVTLSDKAYLMGIFRDTTGRKQAEKRLIKSEERFRQLSENSHEWIWEVDPNGLYTFASQTEKNMFGYKNEELVYKKYFYDLFLPEEREELKNAAFEVFKQQQPFREFINRNVTKNGEIIWLSTNGVPILDSNGNFLGYRGSDVDITDRINTEKELRKYREHLEELVKERTMELEEKNKELEQFNKLFVDREFRIKELRDRVKELEGRDS